MRRRGLNIRVADLAAAGKSANEIAEALDTGSEYVRKTLIRMGLHNPTKRGPSIKTIARRRLDLLRRAHEVICRDEQDGAVYAQLMADMKEELDA